MLQSVEVEAGPAARRRGRALFFDDDGQLLIVEPIYKSTWEIPGGAVEHGETPYAACVRELRAAPRGS
jgi:8-oxo-dGTP pyrophosphatase MutT (NUDIX family)